jgi:hypothetical protein
MVIASHSVRKQTAADPMPVQPEGTAFDVSSEVHGRQVILGESAAEGLAALAPARMGGRCERGGAANGPYHA